MHVGFRSAWLLGALALVLAVGCRREPEPAPAQYPPGQYPPGQYPPGQYPPGQYADPNYPQQYPPQQYPPQQYPPQQPPGAYAPPVSTAPAPAGGVPCQADTDPQCPFGRCVGGKCGACNANEHCKPGAACMQTPLGGTCVPSMGTAPPG